MKNYVFFYCSPNIIRTWHISNMKKLTKTYRILARKSEEKRSREVLIKMER